MAQGVSPPRNNSPLQSYLAKNGRFPIVSLQVQPIDPTRAPIEVNNFMEYNFNSSVLVPVDAFSFTMRNPTLSGSLYSYIQDGDIAILKANGNIIATGLIDSVTITTDPDNGEVVHLQGRTLVGQLEDQSTVNDIDDPIWGANMSPEDVINALVLSTRINFYRLQQTPIIPDPQPLFATEPGESKFSALLRYLEPLNCIVWMDPDGTIVIGRPDMGAGVSGQFTMDRDNRVSNCLSISVAYSSTQIPNVIIPVWTGQETVQSRVAPEQALLNAAQGPSRLYKNKHHVPKSVTVSTPQGSDAQAQADANQISLVGGANVLQAYAKREIARANVNEVNVQVNIKGHYNSDLSPVLIDSTYNIHYPRAGLSEKMYLHTVGYSMDETAGQKTALTFCRLGSIVSDITLLSAKSQSQKTQVSS